MSRCEVALTLDRTDRTYQFSEVVSGTVQVQVDSKCDPSQIELWAEWRTHGRGDPDCGFTESFTLFEGSWEPGSTYRYPFNLIAPNGPATYHGHDLNVDWYIRVKADIPVAPIKAERDILLLPPKQDATDASRPEPGRADLTVFNLGPLYQPPAADRLAAEIRPGTDSSCRTNLVLSLAPIPLLSRLILSPSDPSLNLVEGVAVLVGFMVHLEVLQFIIGQRKPSIGRTRYSLALIVGLPWLVIFWSVAYSAPFLADVIFATSVGLVGGYLYFKSIRQRALGPILLYIQPSIIPRGESICCQMQFNACQRGIDPIASATLLAEEIILRVGNTPGVAEAVIRTRRVFESSSRLVPIDSSRFDGATVLQTLLHVPEDAPLTFIALNNRLLWQVALRVTAKGVPAWSALYPVTICP